MNETGALILIVDDEPQMRRFLRASLSSHGYRFIEAENGTEALSLTASHNPAVILLDLGLPDIDGLEVTQRLREWTQVPIIVLSARGQEQDKVEALDAGADDYLTKPFSVAELLARIRVALRHGERLEGEAPPTVFEFASFRLDVPARRVTKSGQDIHLTPIEFKLVVVLAKNAGRVVTQRQLLKEVWGPNFILQSQYLRVYMAQLRHKLEDDPTRPQVLITEPGVGYRLVGQL